MTVRYNVSPTSRLLAGFDEAPPVAAIHGPTVGRCTIGKD